MLENPPIAVIIPALNEAESISDVVRAIPRPLVSEVLVVDNGSADATARLATEAGARVISEPRRGYGRACLAGIAALSDDTQIIVFLDADGSDDPSLIPELVRLLVADRADLVVGSRLCGVREQGSMTPTQLFGNHLASAWLRLRFGLHATDLGPLRAITRARLAELEMRDPSYGWTVEMQLKAAQRRLRYAEICVPYRCRYAGRSKVSGTLAGTLGASAKILGLLALHDFRSSVRRR